MSTAAFLVRMGLKPGLAIGLQERPLALALRVAINGFFLLLGLLPVGSYVLEFFGITLPVLRIAGGVVVTAFGWTLLQRGQELENQRNAEAAQGSDGDGFTH